MDGIDLLGVADVDGETAGQADVTVLVDDDLSRGVVWRAERAEPRLTNLVCFPLTLP